MKISVTEEDIVNGTQCCGETCPIALAARRAFSDQEYIDVNDRHMLVGHRFYQLPPDAISFIRRFDADRDSAFPLSFEVE